MFMKMLYQAHLTICIVVDTDIVQKQSYIQLVGDVAMNWLVSIYSIPLE